MLCRDYNKMYQIDMIDDLFGTKAPECWKTYIPIYLSNCMFVGHQ
jgi:hypothetical protein